MFAEKYPLTPDVTHHTHKNIANRIGRSARLSLRLFQRTPVVADGQTQLPADGDGPHGGSGCVEAAAGGAYGPSGTVVFDDDVDCAAVRYTIACRYLELE